MNYIKQHKSTILRELFFILLALLFILPMLIHGFIPCGDDWGYHIDRIIEISNNMRHGNSFPIMYTYTFRKIGYLLGAFYPWITLLPFAILKNLISNQVTAIALGFSFYIFLSLNLTYHISNKLFKNRIQALLTSLIYVFSGYILVDCYRRTALGEFLAMMFIPVAVYGFYEVLFGNARKWPYLAFGMSAIMLSHVLSTFIISLTFIIIFIVLFHWVDKRKERIIKLIYSIMVFISSSAIFLLPFIEQEKYQKFGQPSPVPLQGQNFGDIIVQSLNGSGYSLGTLAILTFILGMVFWNKLNRIEKASYVIGTIALIIASSLFPWTFFNKTPLSVIQYPFRIFTITTVFYAVVLGKLSSLVCQAIINKSDGKFIVKLLTMIVASIIIFLPWLGSAMNYINAQASNNNPGIQRFTKNCKAYTDLGGLWLDQYTPQNSKKYLNNVIQGEVIADGSKQILSVKDIVSQPNALEFKGKITDSANSLELPVFNYKNIHVFRDGKEVKWNPSSNNTVSINTSGIRGPVTVKYIPSTLDWIGIFLSIGTWIIALIIGLLSKVRKRSN